MTRLDRRVDALEAGVERARQRRLGELANERGITLAALMARHAEAQAERERLRAEGLSDDAITALKADRLGLPVEELRRRADELVRHLS